jgi:hypothetical protein
MAYICPTAPSFVPTGSGLFIPGLSVADMIQALPKPAQVYYGGSSDWPSIIEPPLPVASESQRLVAWGLFKDAIKAVEALLAHMASASTARWSSQKWSREIHMDRTWRLWRQMVHSVFDALAGLQTITRSATDHHTALVKDLIDCFDPHNEPGLVLPATALKDMCTTVTKTDGLCNPKHPAKDQWYSEAIEKTYWACRYMRGL